MSVVLNRRWFELGWTWSGWMEASLSQRLGTVTVLGALGSLGETNERVVEAEAGSTAGAASTDSSWYRLASGLKMKGWALCACAWGCWEDGRGGGGGGGDEAAGGWFEARAAGLIADEDEARVTGVARSFVTVLTALHMACMLSVCSKREERESGNSSWPR